MEISQAFAMFIVIYLEINLSCSCILLLNGWKPIPLKERAKLADVILVARATKTFKNQRTKAGTYISQFLVDKTIKGANILQKISNVPNQRNVYNISNFGDKSQCYAEIDVGEKYILFLTTFKNHLSAKYDDIFGAASQYSIKDEDAIYRDLGWGSWSDWSPCDKPCNSGTQTHRRRCQSDKCTHENPPEVRRDCNIFLCKGLHDFMSVLGFHFLPKGVSKLPDRKNAFVVSSITRLFAPLANFMKPKFPLDFSILLTLRIQSPASGGFIFGITDIKGQLKLAIKIEEKVVRFYYADFSGKPGVSASPSFTASLTDGQWHHLAFSVEGTLILMYVDCVIVGKEKLDRSGGFDHRKTVLSVPAPFGRNLKMGFQGDLEQMVVVENPQAAALQCRNGRVTSPAEVVTEEKVTDTMRGDGRNGLETTTHTPARTVSCTCRNGFCNGHGICRCWSGYKGKTCNEATCCPACQNGGRCIQPNLCQCAHGTYGRYCQNVHCRQPCLNGGRCTMFDRCVCPSGYYGYRCHMRQCVYRAMAVPYVQGHMIPVTEIHSVPCNQWSWVMCQKTRVFYRMAYRINYRTQYKCTYPGYKMYRNFMK